jgi:divalent metal cation (Fe/Co/Zn/Cd) transporter
MLLGCALDLGILVPYAAAAVWSDSLTLIGEVIRGGLLLLLELYLLVLLRRIQRGQLVGYDFGTAKLEQFANLVVGAAMIASACWMLMGIATRWHAPPPREAGGLVFGLLIAAANLGVNLAALRSVWRAGRDGTSIILSGQIRARLSKTLASAMVVLVALVNAVGSERVGAVADLVGAALVTCVMVSLGWDLLRGALPPLLDRTLEEARQLAINQALARHFDRFDALGVVRSRIIGRDPSVEIGLGFDPGRRMAEVQAVADLIAEEVRGLIPGARVTVIPYALTADQPGATAMMR